MNLRNAVIAFRLQHLILALILGLSFYLTLAPHLGYPYPLHIDEWIHLGRSEAMMRGGSLIFADPYSGAQVTGLASNLEASFQMFWGVFQSISGIDWLTIFRYFPGIIFGLTVLSAYILARREGFGLEAALFTALIPTTVGVLGPAFLVPVSLGLLFTPLILFLAFNFRTVWSYSLIFVFTSFLLAIHAPSAIYPLIVLVPYILLNLRGNFKHSLGLAAALILPFLVVFPWIFNLLLSTARGLLTRQAPSGYVQLPKLIQDYGYLPVLACLGGIFLLAMRGGKKNFGMILGLLALLLMLVSYSSFDFGVAILYERGLVYVMLMVSIVAGAGLAGIRNVKLPERVVGWLKTSKAAQRMPAVLCVGAASLVLAVTIPQRLQTPYYHMIDEQDYEAFVWIRDNVGDGYYKAMVDPWKATAFIAITGKDVYSRLHTGFEKTDETAYAFLRSGSSNTTLLETNGISLVYTRLADFQQGTNTEVGSSNPDLVEVARNVYVLKSAR